MNRGTLNSAIPTSSITDDQETSEPDILDEIGDMPLLTGHFLSEFKPESPSLAPGVLEMLQSYPWPGNVRELRNEVQCAAALSEPGTPLQIRHFSPHLTRDERLVQDTLSGQISFSESVGRYQRRLIREALAKCQGNRTHAANYGKRENEQVGPMFSPLLTFSPSHFLPCFNAPAGSPVNLDSSLKEPTQPYQSVTFRV